MNRRIFKSTRIKKRMLVLAEKARRKNMSLIIRLCKSGAKLKLAFVQNVQKNSIEGFFISIPGFKIISIQNIDHLKIVKS